MKRTFITILILINVPLLLFGYQNITITDKVKENIQQRVDAGENTGIVVGVIDADVTDFFSYGKKSLKGTEKVDEYSIFEIGSISKVFTTLLLAQMIEKGNLSLIDPIEKFLPDEVNVPARDGKKITLEHLATHTSALPRMPTNFFPADPGNPFADYTVEKMYDFLNDFTLRRDIGERFLYSNIGMGLLGHILTLQTGKDYERLIKEQICTPLEMHNTGITISPELEKHLAKGHSRQKEVQNWDIPTLAGAGALRSTAVDILKFLAANLGLTSTNLFSEMEMCHETRVDASADMKVGLGWAIRENDNTKIIWHNGGTGGYRTFCGFVKENKTGVVVLSNSNAGADDIGFHLLDNYYNLKKISIGINLYHEILDKYTGEY